MREAARAQNQWQHRLKVRATAAFIFCCLPLSALADETADHFQAWLRNFWPKAAAAGISYQTFTTAFDGVAPDPEVLQKFSSQPEHVSPIWDYVEATLKPERLAKGQKYLVEYDAVLTKLEQQTGVDRAVVIAIWGLESSFGINAGRSNVIRSLATLAFAGGTKAKYGETQLLAALGILQHGDIPAKDMLGSWAGAMGQTQFIPTTYNSYAVDFDGDGRRDIWADVPDALASTANYLAKSRFKRGVPWGIEVKVPDGFDYQHSGFGREHDLAFWTKLGILARDGKQPALGGAPAALWLPAGARGPAFLVTASFKAILRYNHALSYALAIGVLSDRMRGLPPIATDWPRDDRPLDKDERRELQQHLIAFGASLPTPDGTIGESTRTAIRAFQKRIGIATDGLDSKLLLDRLRAHTPG